MAPQAQQGSQERAPADWGGQANIESKSAGVEKAGQPGNSGESGKAFVSGPLAASRRAVTREVLSRRTFGQLFPREQSQGWQLVTNKTRDEAKDQAEVTTQAA